VDTSFSGELFEWRGPAPFFWVALPDEACDYVRDQALGASYGWGAIPVLVRVGRTEWETSLLPRDGGYVLPVKKAVREREQVVGGDAIAIGMSVAPRGGRAAQDEGETV